MNTYLDCETIPQQPEAETKAEIAKTIEAPATMKKAETIADWHNGAGKYAGVKDAAIEEAYRKTALDGGKGELFSIACSSPEIDILTEFFSWVSEEMKHESANPYFIGHNIAWDLKFIWQRAVILGVQPPFKLPFGGKHKSDYYDNMQAWAGYNQRISQDNLCKALGMDGKRDEVTGSNIWDHVKQGSFAAIAIYNKHDVEDVINIYNRINFIG